MPYKDKEKLKEFRQKYQSSEKYKKYKQEYYLKNREKYLKKGIERYLKRNPNYSNTSKKIKSTKSLKEKYFEKSEKARLRYQRNKNSPEFLKKCLLQQQKYNLKNPEKSKARYTLRHAVNYQKIIKRGFCHCGKVGEAHHPDYSKPLDVIWLCRKHHMELHRK